MIKCLNFNLISYFFHLTPSCLLTYTHIHSFNDEKFLVKRKKHFVRFIGFSFLFNFYQFSSTTRFAADDEDMRVVESTIDKSPSISLLRINFLNFIYATENEWMWARLKVTASERYQSNEMSDEEKLYARETFMLLDLDLMRILLQNVFNVVIIIWIILKLDFNEPPSKQITVVSRAIRHYSYIGITFKADVVKKYKIFIDLNRMEAERLKAN